MSSALAREAADKKSTRILRRDERRQVEDSYRVRGAGINKAVTKEVTKNPTRVIPDLPGFHPLTKLEFKRDTRDIDKRSSLMNMNETDSEDELETSVPVTLRPPCNPNSTAYKKKERFVAWLQNPAIVERDMKQAIDAPVQLKRELARVIKEEAKWLNSLEMGRSQVCASLTKNKECIARMCREMQHLYSLALAECGPAMRKRRSLSMRDCLEELNERKTALSMCIQEYDRLAYDALAAASEKDAGKTKPEDMALSKGIPITRITLKEDDLLVYQCDTEVFASRSEGSGSRSNQAVDTEAAFRESVETSRIACQVKAEEEAAAERLLQRNSEQREIAAAIDIPRGTCLSAVDGAAGSANDDARVAAEAAAEEKQSATRISRSKEVLRVKETSEKAASSSTGTESTGENVNGGMVGGTVVSDHSKDLLQYFNSVEEAVVSSRSNLGDLDVFFGEDLAGADAKIRAFVARSSSFCGSAGVSSPRTPRSGSIVDDVIRELGPGDGSMRAVKAVTEVTQTLVPKSEAGKALVIPLENLQTETDWVKHFEAFVSSTERGDSIRRKRRASSSIQLQTFVYGRTPRGVPLLVSPLSQFEDRYIGAIYGGVPGTSLYNGTIDRATNFALPRACASLPPELVKEEDRVMEHCLLQSAAASAETRSRRLRNSLQEFRRQREYSEISHATAEQVYIHTLLEDTIESKRIRRELHTFGIASEPLADRNIPMSPLAETSGWNSNSTESNGRQVGGGRGVALGAHYSRGPSWGRGKAKKGAGHLEKAQEAQRYNEQAVREAALYRLENNSSSTRLDEIASQVSDNEDFAAGADNGATNGEDSEVMQASQNDSAAESEIPDAPPKKKVRGVGGGAGRGRSKAN